MAASDPAIPSMIPHAAFATTRWSLIVSADRERNSTPETEHALSTLCETYWFPLYAYARRRVSNSAEAQDLTQSFFAELLAKNIVATANPARGRFRAFLLTAFKHYLSHEWEKQRAQKRGGGRAPLSLDFDSADTRFHIEPESRETAEQAFDREWTVTLLGQILERLQAEFTASGKSQQFDELKPFLIGEQSGRTYAEVAECLGISESAAKMSVSRMRKRYRELLRAEIGQTVTDPQEIDDEIRHLFASMNP